jgi:hypothetical protein
MCRLDARRVGDVHANSDRQVARGVETFERAFDGVLIPAGHRHAQALRKKLAARFKSQSTIRAGNHSHSVCHFSILSCSSMWRPALAGLARSA